MFTDGENISIENDPPAAAQPLEEQPATEYVKSPSETDAEFAERKRAAEFAKPIVPLNLEKRGKFQQWLDQNYRTIPFPALQQLERLLDDHVGKLSAADAKTLEAERKRLGV